MEVETDDSILCGIELQEIRLEQTTQAMAPVESGDDFFGSLETGRVFKETAVTGGFFRIWGFLSSTFQRKFVCKLIPPCLNEHDDLVAFCHSYIVVTCCYSLWE